MLELISEIPFVSLFIKFMIASTVLMGAVWLMEKVRLINTPDLAELAWKLAIAGSFVALLPIADFFAPSLVIEDSRTAAIIDDLNENRPLSDLAPQGTTQTVPAYKESTQFLTSGRLESVLNATRAIEAAQARLKENGIDFKYDTETVVIDGQKFNIPFGDDANINGSIKASDEIAAAINTDTLSNGISTAADTNNALILNSENDSESTIEKTFWYSAADLRTKDLAALGWAALALLTVAALMFSYRDAVKNLGSRTRVGSEDTANKVLRSICAKADIRHVPYLSRSETIKSPVCLPRKEICLPDWAFDDMPAAEFKSLLAHELGHMVRRDPIMLMALQLLSRIFFFQPLFIIARKRLTDIAELAADEWAANQAVDSRAVANALFTCATKIHETRQIQWGLAMAGNKSILKQRVERLIHAQSVPFKTTGAFTKTALGIGVIGLSLGLPSVEFADAVTAESPMAHGFHDTPAPKVSPLPALPNVSKIPNVVNAPPAPQMPASSTIVSRVPSAVAVASSFASASAIAHPRDIHIVNRGHESGNLSWSDDDKSISVKWEGDFQIGPDDASIELEDDDGYLRIKSKEDGVRRSIRFKVKDGKRTHTYKVNGDQKELDKEGQKWLKSSIRILINTGFGAEQRVARILKKNKAKGVLKEVKGFDGDFVKRIYLSELMDQTDLSGSNILQVVDIVGKFDSDFEKRLTLSALLEEEDISDKVLPKVLAVAKGLDSDFEKRLLVTHFVSEMKLTNKSTAMVIDIAETIDSDFELRLLLTATLTETKLTDKNVQRILDLAIKRIDSDFEKRLLLTSFADEYDRSDAVVAKVLDAAKTIDSDFERRLLLSTIINEADMNEKNWLKAIAIASDIDSDFEKNRALMHFKSEAPENNKKVVAALEKAMEGMDQEFTANREFISHEGFSVVLSEDYAEAMADLAKEMAMFELERAEIIQEMRDEEDEAVREALREKSRSMRDKQREMRAYMNEQKQVQRQVERAEAMAMREIEREMRMVERELSKASKTLKRELAQVMRDLERTKRDLERQHSRGRVAFEEKHKKKHDDKNKDKKKSKASDNESNI